jgi:hypothetical protein
MKQFVATLSGSVALLVCATMVLAQSWVPYVIGPSEQVLNMATMTRVLHRIEMVQIAEEFVEAMHGRQKLVPVAKVVLAELSGGVPHRLQHGRYRGGLIGHPSGAPA